MYIYECMNTTYYTLVVIVVLSFCRMVGLGRVVTAGGNFHPPDGCFLFFLNRYVHQYCCMFTSTGVEDWTYVNLVFVERA